MSYVHGILNLHDMKHDWENNECEYGICAKVSKQAQSYPFAH